jgi:hypothetical protein
MGDARVLIGLGTSFVLFLVGLILVVELYYLPTVGDTVETQCVLTNCFPDIEVCYDTTCTSSSTSSTCTTSSYNCYFSKVDFYKEFDGKMCRNRDQYPQKNYMNAENFCNNHPNGTMLDCYYDKRKPCSTLSLSKAEIVVGPIIVIVIFSVITASLLFCFLLFLYFAIYK